DAQLRVASGVDRLLERVAVADRDDLDREDEAGLEAVMVAVAVIAADLELRVPRQRTLLGDDRKRGEDGDRRSQTSKCLHGDSLTEAETARLEAGLARFIRRGEERAGVVGDPFDGVAGLFVELFGLGGRHER